MRDDEPRPVWMSLLITHSSVLVVYFFKDTEPSPLQDSLSSGVPEISGRRLLCDKNCDERQESMTKRVFDERMVGRWDPCMRGQRHP
jgi:hypothetical protein